MNQRPLIILTNDDGIDSPGLHASAEALSPMADLLIAAPSGQQTATGRAIGGKADAMFQSCELSINGEPMNAWHLCAPPATTVHHALQCLLDGRVPDMVVSGINFGENIGSCITSSGTVGAAIEAASWGYKALAVSMEVPQKLHFNHGKVDWSSAILILRQIAARLLARDWPQDVHVMKIDIPDDAVSSTPLRVCRQSLEPGWWAENPDAGPESPIGSLSAKRGPRPGRQLREDDDLSVFQVMREVAVTPLSIDMTARVNLKELEPLIGKP